MASPPAMRHRLHSTPPPSATVPLTGYARLKLQMASPLTMRDQLQGLPLPSGTGFLMGLTGIWVPLRQCVTDYTAHHPLGSGFPNCARANLMQLSALAVKC